MNSQEIEEKTRELMEMVGLDYEKFANRYPAELSGGREPKSGNSPEH